MNIGMWFVTALSLCGNILVIKKSRNGFICWAVANIFLTIHNFSILEYAQGTLFFVYFWLAVWGILAWKPTRE